MCPPHYSPTYPLIYLPTHLPIPLNLRAQPKSVTSLDLNKQGRLVVHIIGAVDLLSADSNGLSDPYVKVRSLLSPHSPP